MFFPPYVPIDEPVEDRERTPLMFNDEEELVFEPEIVLKNNQNYWIRLDNPQDCYVCGLPSNTRHRDMGIPLHVDCYDNYVKL